MSKRATTEIKGVDPDLLDQGGMFPQILRELDHHKDQSRLLLVVAVSFVDLMVATLVETHCKNPRQVKNLSRPAKVTVLNELGLVADGEREALHWLRLKRDAAAHEPDFRFTDADMPDWADEHHKTADKLFSLCVQLLGNFWNERVALFRVRLPLEGEHGQATDG